MVRPKVFVAENVAGVTAAPHRQYWERLRQLLGQSGYRTADLICEGRKMGVPQLRKRAVMLAWSSERDLEPVLPILDGGTIRDALGNLRGVSNHEEKRLSPQSELFKIAMRIKPGQKLSNVRGGPRAVHTWQIPEIFGETSAEEKRLLETIMRLRRRRRVRETGDADPLPIRIISAEFGEPTGALLAQLLRKGYVRRLGRWYDLTHTFNGKFRRLDFDSASPTVDTRFGDPRYFLHPKEQRGLTVREAARIQGFPDSFLFHGSERAQYRVIGNAVPPPVAFCLARLVGTLLRG